MIAEKLPKNTKKEMKKMQKSSIRKQNKDKNHIISEKIENGNHTQKNKVLEQNNCYALSATTLILKQKGITL
jgi:hypothetical protein